MVSSVQSPAALEGVEYTLYRGRHPVTQAPVLLRVHRKQDPRNSGRLRRELDLADVLNPQWALRPLAVVRERGRAMLMLEDPGDDLVNLAHLTPMAVEQFLRVSIQISAAIAEIHRSGLVHKDLKPDHIILDRSNRVRITGFGLASYMPTEGQTSLAAEAFAGTLAYIAPEQTGYKNQPLDTRSDLYSLGVIFFELLTGRLPFQAGEVSEWIHCHVAREPPALREHAPGIPEAIAGIVTRLLAKAPEERYQSAAGLQADLTRCLASWESHGHIEPFDLAGADAPTLTASASAEILAEQLFEIVGHFNRDANLLVESAERKWVARLNLSAARRSKTASAPKAAIEYLDAAVRLLPSDAWDRCYDLAFEIEFERAECEYLLGAAADAEARLVSLAWRARGIISDLRRSEAFLAEGQRISHTGSWSWCTVTGRVHWSEEHYRLLAIAPSEAPAPTVELFLSRVHPEDREALRELIHGHVARASDFAIDFRVLLPDGTVKFLHGVGRPKACGPGEPLEYIGTTVDVTDRKRVEDALRDAQAELMRAARMASIGELTASIAHEINQPLAAIIANGTTCINWLAQETPKIGRARAAAERVIGNATRAGEIIQSIRAMAQKNDPQMAALDLNEAIREIMVLVSSELRRRRVAIETRYAQDLLPILGSRVQIQQVVVNLIMNAADAMEGIPERKRAIKVSTRREPAGMAITEVSDTGIGLDSAALSRVFEPLYTTKAQGLGIGLSICRSIVAAHNGSISARSTPGEGSSFTVALPMMM